MNQSKIWETRQVAQENSVKSTRCNDIKWILCIHSVFLKNIQGEGES